MTREDLIIRMMPFSKELVEWCSKHPEFREALKVAYPERFISLHAIAISYSPYRPNDQVIGFFAYDYEENQNKFKQDFIVNINSENNEFVIYTRLPNRKYSKYVRDINEFYMTYAKKTCYAGTHHPRLEELPIEIRPRAKKAVNLAEKLKKTGTKELSDEDLHNLDLKLSKLNK